ncbi:ataxin-7-like protein 3 [Rhopilema esculentum]|uniref:ataxin-7-like protein 3 n=1 Tax=Rhopilema esculentum TaxID=499914 RepID=UPI0031DD179E
MAAKSESKDILDPADPFVQYMYEMIDYLALGVCFDVHRTVRLGRFHLDDIDNESQKDFSKWRNMCVFVRTQKNYSHILADFLFEASLFFQFCFFFQFTNIFVSYHPLTTFKNIVLTFFNNDLIQHLSCDYHFESLYTDIVQEAGVDVFGQPPMKKFIECACPNCQRSMASNRFAPHLEKCMGMGRNSSRIASRRIATSGKMEEYDIDDDYDNDWSYEYEKKGRKLRKEKQVNCSPKNRKINQRKVTDPYSSSRMSVTHNSVSVANNTERNAGGASGSTNGTSNSGGSGSRPGTPCSTASGETNNNIKTGPTLQALESLSQDEKIALLMQTCGAISEHTGKMCTRTGRCAQHSDEQRRAVRDLVLGDVDDIPLPPSMRPEGANPLDQDDIHIDVDGYEDMDAGTPLLRDLSQMSWEEGSNVSLGSDIVPVPSTPKQAKKTKSGRRSRNR